MCDNYIARHVRGDADAGRRKVVNGFVYLDRYRGHKDHYKIGRSDDPGRRFGQLSMMVPGKLKAVHIIETDDAPGIEQYWKERFRKQGKLVNGKEEIFRLEASDIAAFKSRKYQ